MLAAGQARALKGTVSPKPSHRGNSCGSPNSAPGALLLSWGAPLSTAQIPGIACWVGAGWEQEEWLSLPGWGWGLGALHHEEPLRGPTQTSACPWMLDFLQPEQLPTHWAGSGLSEDPPGLVSLCAPWGPPKTGGLRWLVATCPESSPGSLGLSGVRQTVRLQGPLLGSPFLALVFLPEVGIILDRLFSASATPSPKGQGSRVKGEPSAPCQAL